MSVHDTIGDALTIIRNGYRSAKDTVELKYSKKIEGIVNILKEEGYVRGYKTVDVKGQKNVQKLQVMLKYNGRKSTISGLKRVSRPGLRQYSTVEKMPRPLNGLGIAVVSTSKGIVSDKKAREMNVGGEVLCYVW